MGLKGSWAPLKVRLRRDRLEPRRLLWVGGRSRWHHGKPCCLLALSKQDPKGKGHVKREALEEGYCKLAWNTAASGLSTMLCTMFASFQH